MTLPSRAPLFGAYYAAAALLCALALGFDAPLELSAPAAGPANSRLWDGELTARRPDGSLIYNLTAETIDYLAAADELALARPRARYQAGEESLVFRGETGRVLDSGAMLELPGRVEVERAARPGRGLETLETRDVTVDLRARVARTEADAVMRRAGQVLSGAGMRADLATGDVRLLSNVRVRSAR